LPSLNPRPASSQSVGVTVRIESHDLERTVSEATMRKIVTPNDDAVIESPTPKMMVTVVAGPSKEVAEASTAQVAALVLWSSHQSVSPHVALGTSSQRLDDNTLREFDDTHRLSKLTTD
jgi:hypothetical protein